MLVLSVCGYTALLITLLGKLQGSCDLLLGLQSMAGNINTVHIDLITIFLFNFK